MKLREALARECFRDSRGRPLRVTAFNDDGRALIEIVRLGADGLSTTPRYSWFYDTLAGTSDLDREPRHAGKSLWLDFGKGDEIDGATMDAIMSWLEHSIGPPPVTPYDDNPDMPF